MFLSEFHTIITMIAYLMDVKGCWSLKSLNADVEMGFNIVYFFFFNARLPVHSTVYTVIKQEEICRVTSVRIL